MASVAAQSYRPLEVIVVDDGSSDATPAVLAELSNQYRDATDFDVRSVRQENAGAPSARNHGGRLARGGWLQFLDSDDLLLPDKIEQGLAIARKEGAEIVYSKAQYVTSEGKRIERFMGKPLSGEAADFFEFSWQTMCALYSRPAFDAIGPWNETLRISQDWEYCIRAVASGMPIRFDDTVRAMYRFEGDDRIGSGQGLSKAKGREHALWEVFDFLEKQGVLEDSLRRRFRSRLLYLLLTYRSLGSGGSARELLQRMRKHRLIAGLAPFVLGRIPGQAMSSWALGRFENRVKNRIATTQ